MTATPTGPPNSSGSSGFGMTRIACGGDAFFASGVVCDDTETVGVILALPIALEFLRTQPPVTRRAILASSTELKMPKSNQWQFLGARWAQNNPPLSE